METSKQAAAKTEFYATKLQQQILDVFKTGDFTAHEIETMEQFKSLAPSTCRKRISELDHALKLFPVGKKDGMSIYSLTPPEKI